jgi:hypothetical protein
MSHPFDQIRDYIDEYDGDDYVSIESGSPASEARLKTISGDLGIELPSEYKRFLSTIGALDIGGIEFAGASDADYLDVVGMRNDLVNQHGFPNDLIPLLNEDGDSYVCVGSNGQLLRWFPNGNAPFLFDESLGAYLLRLCEELIEDEADDE